MRKFQSVAATLAVVAGVLAAPSAASAAAKPAVSEYTFSEIGVSLGNLTAEFAVYSTFSQTQIWINGKVECGATPGWVVSWCSNTNNGQAYLNLGMNLVSPYGSWYERMNLYANYSGCKWWGSSTLTVEFWSCEEPVNSKAKITALRPPPGVKHWVTKSFSFHIPAASVHIPTGSMRSIRMRAGSVYRNPHAQT